VTVGEIWAYRRQAKNIECPVERVEIIEQDKERSGRFVVLFLDDGGRRESVPRNRLIALWSDRELWLADERRMAAVARVSRHAEDTPQYEAVEYVFEVWGLVGGVMIGWGQHEAGSVQIDDLDVLCGALGHRPRAAERPTAAHSAETIAARNQTIAGCSQTQPIRKTPLHGP
jgi:hypothetical protein